MTLGDILTLTISCWVKISKRVVVLIPNVQSCIFKCSIKLNSEPEGRAFEPFSLEANISVNPFHNFLGDHESKSNSSGVDIFSTLDKSKQLEKFLFVLSLDSHAGVLNLDFAEGLSIFLVEWVDHRHRATFVRKLQSIWLNVQNYLLQSTLVCINHQRLVWNSCGTSYIIIEKTFVVLGYIFFLFFWIFLFLFLFLRLVK